MKTKLNTLVLVLSYSPPGPLLLGQRLVVQILATENMYIGSLAFGLTSCDPASLDAESLPEDSDMLLDRSEGYQGTMVGLSGFINF